MELLITNDLLLKPVTVVAEKFLAALADVEKQTEALVVTNADEAALAAQLQARIDKAARELEKERTAATAPFLAIQRDIKKAADTLLARLTPLKTKTKQLLGEYAEAERRREEEKTRQRLAAEKLAREAEAQKRAEEEKARLDKLAAEEPLDIDLPDDGDGAPASGVVFASIGAGKTAFLAAAEPAAVPAKTSVITGARVRETLTYTLADIDALPVAYVTRTLNAGAIRTALNTWKSGDPLPYIPGLKIEIKRDVIANTLRADPKPAATSPAPITAADGEDLF